MPNQISAPGPPLFARLEIGSEMSLDLEWSPPISGGEVDGYEVRVRDEAGGTCGWERVGGAGLRHRFRRLRAGGRYSAVVRAWNLAGVSDASETVAETVYRQPADVPLPAGSTIPIEDHDRQSLIVVLAGLEVRIRIWWQPSDGGWWASLESPPDVPVVSGRRLALNAGLLDRIDGILAGNLVMRDLGGVGVEPGRGAFGTGTHAIRWEPNTTT
jgi:hypothetical protein